MKDYYNLFVQFSLQQCTKNDYADKQKVKAHNVASKKLLQLQDEMKQIDCIDILYDLMSHGDDRVKINAATLCLQMKVHNEMALIVLNKIIDASSDPTMRFSAKMVLQSISQ